MTRAGQGRPVGSSRRRRYAAGPRPAAIRGTSLVGTEIELDVGPVAHGGHCVARHEGRAVFVRHTLPGERVLARITEGGSDDRFLRADAVQVLRRSPGRVEPVCRHAGPPDPATPERGCGGCDWQHVSRAEQLRLKTAVVREQLHRLAGIDWAGAVESVPGDDDGLGWRTRVELAVDETGRVGLRQHRSHVVVPVLECPIVAERAWDPTVLEQDWSGHRTVELVAPSLGEPVIVPAPSPATRPAEPEPIRELVETASWRGEFALDPGGFWQVHPGAARTLLARVLAELDAQPGERVLDLYAGVGLFALPLADAVGVRGRVAAVESDPRAAGHAVANAASRPWVQVVQARVEHALDGLGPADLIVLDPPRTGAGRAVVEAISRLGPRRICYVACDPAALARDLGYAAAAGYRLSGLAAYDLFPMTHHVECVATLEPT